MNLMLLLPLLPSARANHMPNKIAELNDQVRKTLGGCRLVFTSGIIALPDAITVLEKVQAFDAFGPANDPYDEHDFGSFDHNGEVIFWKIDYYDLDLSMRSPDPADPNVTIRVLTIMLAEEY